MNNTTRTEPTRLTVNDVMGRLERGENLVFIDSRNPAAWSESDIKLPGALRVSANDVSAHLSDIPRESTIITYCT